MAQEPSGDGWGFFPRPGSWQSDPSNGSDFLEVENATVNITQSVYGDEPFPYYYIIIMHLVALLIGLCGLLGNGTVIWLLGFRVKRNPFSVYILNLAIVDFLLLLFFIIHMMLAFFSSSDEVDVFIDPFLSTSYLAEQSLLMAISTERCVSALFPIWYRCHRPAHLSAIVCAVVWGLSLCLGILLLFCIYYDPLCVPVNLVYVVTSFLTLLVLCASDLTLLIRVRCGSGRRQTTKLYRVILLTVLAFLVLGLPLSIGLLINLFFPSLFYIYYTDPIINILSILNCGVNPVIYFFVGRHGQQPGRKSLREVLQSALTEDT